MLCWVCKYYAFPSVPSTTILNGVSGSTTSRIYRKYIYDLESEANYVLRPNVESVNKLDSDVSTYALIGTDDRVKAKNLDENTGLVYLSTGGTGFIVGDHVIATAAHCVYNTSFESKMDIYTYSKSGELSGDMLTAVEAHVPQSYTSSFSTQYDYALITVEDDLSEDNGYFHFKLGTAYNAVSPYFSNIPIYVTGYPSVLGDDNSIHNPTFSLYTGEGKVINLDNNSSYASNNKQILYYDVDTTWGDSGAPVYAIIGSQIGNEKPEYTPVVLAVHRGGHDNSHNLGSLITNYHLQFYISNPNIDY